jgi:alkane 1-monooxygenase
MIPAPEVAKIQNAIPFWMSLLLIPIALIGATQGGWTIALLPLTTWILFSIIDHFVGLNKKNADLQTTEAQLGWYKAITLIWVPVQFCLLYWMIWYVSNAGHLSTAGKFGMFFGVGVVTGTIGINYSHELMHQKDKGEQFLADLLLAMTLYSHFRSEHLQVHHRYVGTPRDPATARYNEGFHRFFPRVLLGSLKSAFRAEKAMLARKNKPWHDLSNPFFRYWGLQGLMLLLALWIGGWLGLGLFIWQAFVAIWQLELVNYIEHYGLTRKHLGGGKYEHVLPQHSWNAAQKATNWLLINLQRHSDHHYKPDRRFPLLQHHSDMDAPQLPHGYPLMTMAAMVPPIWRRLMNPRVRRWRKMYYPEITDWKPYNKARNPQPR